MAALKENSFSNPSNDAKSLMPASIGWKIIVSSINAMYNAEKLNATAVVMGKVYPQRGSNARRSHAGIAKLVIGNNSSSVMSKKGMPILIDCWILTCWQLFQSRKERSYKNLKLSIAVVALPLLSVSSLIRLMVDRWAATSAGGRRAQQHRAQKPKIQIFLKFELWIIFEERTTHDYVLTPLSHHTPHNPQPTTHNTTHKRQIGNHKEGSLPLRGAWYLWQFQFLSVLHAWQDRSICGAAYLWSRIGCGSYRTGVAKGWKLTHTTVPIPQFTVPLSLWNIDSKLLLLRIVAIDIRYDTVVKKERGHGEGALSSAESASEECQWAWEEVT